MAVAAPPVDAPAIVHTWIDRRRVDAEQSLKTAQELLPLARTGELYRHAPLAATPEQMRQAAERSDEEVRRNTGYLAHLADGGQATEEMAVAALEYLRAHHARWAGVTWQDILEDADEDAEYGWEEARDEYEAARASSASGAQQIQTLQEWMIDQGFTVPEPTV